MAYKDPDKQRETQKERQRRYRAERGRQAYPKGVTDSRRDKAKGVTNAGCDGQGVTEVINDIGVRDEVLEAEGLKPERTDQGNIRVSKPGDADYVPQCETTRAFIEGRDKRPEVGKRGKDIKCFEDLPPYVQGVIHKLSTIDGKIDQTSKANRTAIAIHYQHIFPDRFHSVGVAG